MTMNAFPKSPAELDAAALADMLGGPPAAWVPIEAWLATHPHVSKTYVQQQYNNARKRGRAAELFPANARPAAPTLTDSEAAFLLYLAASFDDQADTVASLTKRFDLSAPYVRSELHRLGLRAPETPGSRSYKRKKS